VFWIARDCQSLLLESLLLQEVGHPRSLLFRDRRQNLVGSVKVLPHHCRLVLEHREEQLERDHVQLLVAQVQAVVGGNVAEQIHGPVGYKR